MSKALLLLLVVTQILVLQAMALQDSEAPLLPVMKPFETTETKRVNNDDIAQNNNNSKAHDENKSVEQPVGGSTTTTTTESSSEGESAAVAMAPDQIRRLGKHHSTDKSVAGGGVILGGLVTATFAAVFCYIRVTRRRDTHDDY